MLSYESIKDKQKLLKVMTNLNKEEFKYLRDLFEQAWDEYKENEGYHDESQGGRKPVLKSPEDKLFFILFYIRNIMVDSKIHGTKTINNFTEKFNFLVMYNSYL